MIKKMLQKLLNDGLGKHRPMHSSSDWNKKNMKNHQNYGHKHYKKKYKKSSRGFFSS